MGSWICSAKDSNRHSLPLFNISQALRRSLIPFERLRTIASERPLTKYRLLLASRKPGFWHTFSSWDILDKVVNTIPSGEDGPEFMSILREADHVTRAWRECHELSFSFLSI